MIVEMDIIIKLLLATLLGGLIGFLREIGGKAAGLRTHILVTLGSSLLAIISIYIGLEFEGADVGRIAAGVVTGIGFIGAGAIIRDRGQIRGITTAASIWICAAIGLTVGVGLYATAIAATAITLIVLEILRHIEKKYIKKEI